MLCFPKFSLKFSTSDRLCFLTYTAGLFLLGIAKQLVINIQLIGEVMHLTHTSAFKCVQILGKAVNCH